MNRQIVRLTYVALLLVALLVVGTTYWQTWAAPDLAARADNSIKRVAEFQIDRGLIFSFAPRKRLARNREAVVDGKTLFFRRYPYGPLTAHVVGYSTAARSRTGLERSLNDYLTASNANLSTALDKALEAAEVIHSDIKKGFIRAEVVAYKDLMDAGSHAEARKQGTVRLEGKTYSMKDGDIVNFRFNV